MEGIVAFHAIQEWIWTFSIVLWRSYDDDRANEDESSRTDRLLDWQAYKNKVANIWHSGESQIGMKEKAKNLTQVYMHGMV